MSIPQDLFSLSNFTFPRIWSFYDGEINHRKTASLEDKKTGFALNVKTDESHVQSYSNNFNTITATDGYSRITLFSGYGVVGPFIFTTARTVEIKPRYLIHQFGSTKKIIPEVNNFYSYINGINSMLDVNLLKFEERARQFEEKKDYYFEFEVTENLTVRLEVNFDTEKSEKDNFMARHENIVRLKFKKPVAVEEAIYGIKKIEDFFNFVFKDVSNATEFYSTRPGRRRFPVFWKIVLNGSKDILTSYSRNNFGMLFNWEDIQNPDEIIKKWIENYETISTYWSSLKYIKSQGVSENERFLTLIRTLEGIHRGTLSDVSQETLDERESRNREILSKIENKKNRNLVKRALKMAYEPSLEERLLKINELCSSVGLESLSNEMVKKMANTRNVILHQLKEKPERPTLTFIEQYNASRIMAMQLKIILMVMIHIPISDIREIVSARDQFKNFYRD